MLGRGREDAAWREGRDGGRRGREEGGKGGVNHLDSRGWVVEGR